MKTIDEIKQPTGALYSLVEYVSWEPGDAVIVLDGEFTAAQLRAFADHMDANQVKSK